MVMVAQAYNKSVVFYETRNIFTVLTKGHQRAQLEPDKSSPVRVLNNPLS